MKEWTQTNLEPGNCWQTCVASILEIDPESMPIQHEHERIGPDGRIEGHYSGVLNTYLRKHFNLTYAQLYENQWPCVQVRDPGWHMLIGPTVRTATNNRKHMVVARYGEMVWDPHPSRAGLLHVESWGILAPFPSAWTETWTKNARECACLACKG